MRKLTLRSKHSIQLLTTAVAVLPASCRHTNASLSSSSPSASAACRPHYELRFFDLDNVAGSSDALIGAVTLVHPSASFSASASSSFSAASAASWPRVTHLDTSLVTITHTYGPNAHGPGTVTGGGVGIGGSGSSGSGGSSTDGTLVVGWSDGAMGFYAVAAWRELRQWTVPASASATKSGSSNQHLQRKHEEDAQPRRAHAPLLTQRNVAQPELDGGAASPFNTRARWASVSRSAAANAASAADTAANAASGADASAAGTGTAAGTAGASAESASASGGHHADREAAAHEAAAASTASVDSDPSPIGGESCIPPFSSRMITRVHVVTEMTARAPPMHRVAAASETAAFGSDSSAGATGVGVETAASDAEAKADDTTEPSVAAGSSAASGADAGSAASLDRSVLATSVYAWRAHRVVAAVHAHGLISITHWNGTVLDRMWLDAKQTAAAASSASLSSSSSNGASSSASFTAGSGAGSGAAAPLITAAIVIPAVTGSQQNGQGRFLVATQAQSVIRWLTIMAIKNSESSLIIVHIPLTQEIFRGRVSAILLPCFKKTIVEFFVLTLSCFSPASSIHLFFHLSGPPHHPHSATVWRHHRVDARAVARAARVQRCIRTDCGCGSREQGI